MINFWQGLWDQKVPKGDLKYASISLALNSPWMIKATKDDKGRIGFQLIAEKNGYELLNWDSLFQVFKDVS